MKPKHTPGPWALDNSVLVKKDGYVIVMSGVNLEVDESQNEGESWMDMRKRTEPLRAKRNAERKANMKLIVASPDMLEALEQLKDILEDDGLINAGDMRRIVNSAILKATGE